MNPLTRNRRRFSPEETRARIVAEAEALFRRLGFGKTTVADIAEALGMSSANIYKFFPSKNAIIQAAVDASILHLEQDILRAVQTESASAMQRIEAAVEGMAEFNRHLLREEVEVFKLINLAVKECWDCTQRFEAFLLDVVAGLLCEGMASGEFRREDPWPLAESVMDCLALAMQPHLRWVPDSSPDRARTHGQFRLIARALENSQDA